MPNIKLICTTLKLRLVCKLLWLLPLLTVISCATKSPTMSAAIKEQDCPTPPPASAEAMTPPPPSGIYLSKVTASRSSWRQKLSDSPTKSDTSKSAKSE